MSEQQPDGSDRDDDHEQGVRVGPDVGFSGFVSGHEGGSDRGPDDTNEQPAVSDSGSPDGTDDGVVHGTDDGVDHGRDSDAAEDQGQGEAQARAEAQDHGDGLAHGEPADDARVPQGGSPAPQTGDQVVDDALAQAAAAQGSDPAAQLEAYVGTHRTLQERLADSGS